MDLEKSFPAIAAAAGLAAAAYFVSQSFGAEEASMIGGGGGWSVSPPPPPRETGTSATKKGAAATEETQPSITINYPKESDITLTPPGTFFSPPPISTDDSGGRRKFTSGGAPAVVPIQTKKSTPSVDIPRTTTSTVKAASGTGTGRETAAMRAPTPSGRVTTVGPTGKAIGISISAPKSKKTTTRRSIFSRVRSFFRRIA